MNNISCEFQLISYNHVYPTLPLGQYITQGQFFKRGFNRFEFIVFPSPKLVASPRLKNLVCPYFL